MQSKGIYMDYVLRHIPVTSYIQFAYRRMCHVPTYKHMCLYSSPFVKFTETKKRNNSHIGACAYKRGNLPSLFNINLSNNYVTRQSKNFKEIYCRTKIKSMCISVTGPKIWNKLNDEIKNCLNLSKFRSLCKRSFINNYVNDVDV